MTTDHMSVQLMDRVAKFLEKVSIRFKWFSDSLMKSNANKCHLFARTNNTIKIGIETLGIENSDRKNS